MDNHAQIDQAETGLGQPLAPLMDPAVRAEPPENPLQGQVIDAIKAVFDPEIPVNIYELGLIYRVDTNPDGDVEIDMTLTSPSCPSAQSLPGEVEMNVRSVPGVREVKVDVVWDPPWSQDGMSDEAKLTLGLM